MSGESERRSTGAGMEANRKAIGKRLTDDLNRIVSLKAPSGPLKVLEKRGAKPSQTGTGVWEGKAKTSSGGGGIASPLTEKGREYHPNGILSSDGLFQIPALKAVQFLDADGEEVIFNFTMPGS